MSAGLTVEQFSKAERLMSSNSVGHNSCFAGPNFRYIGKGVTVIEEEKLVDVHKTFRKLPKTGNRKKIVEHNACLNIYELPNERVVQAVIEETLPTRQTEDEIRICAEPNTNGYTTIGVRDTSDADLSPSSDSDNDSRNISQVSWVIFETSNYS